MKPCDCDPPRYVPGEPFQVGRDCGICWRYFNDAHYRALWDEHPPPAVGKWFLRLRRCYAFARALVRWAHAGFPTIREDSRKAICQTCPEYQPQSDTCRKCGCRLRWKRRMWTEHCPDTPPRW